MALPNSETRSRKRQAPRSERKAARAGGSTVTTSLAALTTLLDYMAAAVFLLDGQLRILYLNHAAESVLAVSGQRGMGLSLAELFRDLSDLESCLTDALAYGQPYTSRRSELVLTNGNELTVDYTITPVSGIGDACLLIEMRTLDHMLRLDRDETIRVQQLTTREMFRGLAHEIKNPLGGIRGAAQLLEAELPDSELTEYTSVIIEETDRLRALVDRLLGPSSVMQIRELNIHEVVERVCTLIEVETNYQVRVKRDYDPSIPALCGDRELLLQAILNVARNALQSICTLGDEGRITIVTRTERQFTIGTKRHRLVARIDVLDNGPGIPESLRDHLFYPMVSGRAEGTGLGLSVALSIINQHHGLIEFTSHPGRTRFSLLIPLEPNNGSSS